MDYRSDEIKNAGQKKEYWDLLDGNRCPLGRKHLRGTPMQRGEYHLVVFVWVFNSRGELLLTKRSPEKQCYANLWENTGGAAVTGETSLQAIRRELWEETGICAEESEFIFLDSCRGRTWFSDTYVLKKDVALEQLVLPPGETCDARWVTLSELKRMIGRQMVAKPDAARLQRLEQMLTQYFHATK